MKQKSKQIAKSFANYSVLLTMLASILVPSLAVFPQVVQANALCSGVTLDVTVKDETTQIVLGTFSAGGTSNQFEDDQYYNLTVPYNHVITYDLNGGGTPSFTLGYSYVSGSYNHAEHTWSPGATPNMAGTYSAPPILIDSSFWAGKYENVCTGTPQNPGDRSATVHISLTTSGGGTPSTVTRTGQSNLAVYGTPAVSLLADGLTDITVPAGSTPTLSWGTNYVNPGDSCTASNSGKDSSWDGSVAGAGGSQILNSMDNAGLFTYSISCTGFNGSTSLTANVNITVEDGGPSFTCSNVPSGDPAPITKGGTTSWSLQVNPLNGFSEPVTFSLESISAPQGSGKSPAVGFNFNPESSPYSSPLTIADASTDSGTATGAYQVVIKGTSKSGQTTLCPTINVTVLANSGSASINCDGVNSCRVPYGGSSKISWDSSLMTTCTVAKNGVFWDNRLSQAYPPGKDSGSLTVTTTFDLTCDDSDPTTFPIQRSVTVFVDPVNVNPPSSVQAFAGTDCQTAYVTWNRPATGPTPDSYQVYRSTSSKLASFTLIGGIIYDTGNITYKFTDSNPLSPTGVNYYGVKSILGGQSSALTITGGIYPTPCLPILSLSDKDLYKVGNSVNGLAQRCNGQSDVFVLPNKDIFKTGSKVNFRINVCNTGNQNLTGVRVDELDPHNLSSFKLDSSTGCAASGVGTAGPYSIGTVTPNQQCTLNLSGVLKPESGSTGFLYRFWNIAQIVSNEDSQLLPTPGPTRVSTPPYLFSETGTPTRNETAP